MSEDLVERAREGDHAAFAALAQRSSDRLYAVASRILRDPSLAEDAVQETLVEVWRNVRGLRDTTRFEAWATRILVRICYREARQTRARLSAINPEAWANSHDPVGRLADRDQLERGFRRLNVEQRTVLVLRHYLDMEPMEIAATLGVPAGTARSRLHYAHEALRAALEAEARTEGRIGVRP